MNTQMKTLRIGSLKWIAFALGLTLAVAASTAGAAGLRQSAQGDISGQATVDGQGIAGINVELRQRTNGGTDSSLASTTTDGTGTYHFLNQASAPNDAFYYVRFVGGKGALAAWYSFPIIYLSGSQVSVPGVELGDVKLTAPAQNAEVKLPTTFSWELRKMGETYRLFIYAAGKTDKPALDSGSLGTVNWFTVPEGALPPGKYDGLVQVRDTVAGYGQSQSRFEFTVGDGSASSTTAPPAPGTGGEGSSSKQPLPPQPGGTSEHGGPAPAVTPEQAAPPTATAQPQPQPQAAPQINLSLTGDRTSLSTGDSMTYKLEVENTGSGAASGVVVTDKLPDGVAVDQAGITATSGEASVDGSTITVNLGDVAPGDKSTIEIPVKVGDSADSSLSNQATLTYAGAANPVQSNAYIAQVAAPASGPAPSQPQVPAEQQPSAPQENPPAQAPSAPAQQPQAEQPQAQPASPQSGQSNAPASNPPAAQPQAPAASANTAPSGGTQAKPSTAPVKKPAAPMPQTGGGFPIVLAVLFLCVTLLARYLRGLNHRRV